MLAAIATERGLSLRCLAIEWCMQSPHVIGAILGASRVEQIRKNLGAIDVAARLTPAVMARIAALTMSMAD